MADFDHLIQFENEHSALDFKAVQYAKGQHESLLKDILALANAPIDGPRYIIVGVKHLPDGSRTLLGVPEREFVDPATYEQLVTENIEPSLLVSYSAHHFGELIFGVFSLEDCSNAPYLMKKDYSGTLRRGHSFIRRGTHQCALSREDFDRIYHARLGYAGFEGPIDLGFSGANLATSITLSPLSQSPLPSARARSKIETLLEAKRAQREVAKGRDIHPALAELREFGLPDLTAGAMLFGHRPYENRTIGELEEALRTVDRTYRDEDRYELFEKHGHKINIEVLNGGREYIEDASVQVVFPICPELMLASRVHSKPRCDPMGLRVEMPSLLSYPTVIRTASEITVRSHVGDIKHLIPKRVFEEDIRLVIAPNGKEWEISITCTIFAKNLAEPVSRGLTIRVSG